MIVRDFIKSVLLVAMGFAFAQVPEARTNHALVVDAKAFNELQSPLPAGARVVAGDLSKNEFFILAANDAPPHRDPIIQDHPATQLASKSEHTAMKLALKKPAAQLPTRESLDDEEVDEIKVALREATQHPKVMLNDKTMSAAVKKAAPKKIILAQIKVPVKKIITAERSKAAQKILTVAVKKAPKKIITAQVKAPVKKIMTAEIKKAPKKVLTIAMKKTPKKILSAHTNVISKKLVATNHQSTFHKKAIMRLKVANKKANTPSKMIMKPAALHLTSKARRSHVKVATAGAHKKIALTSKMAGKKINHQVASKKPVSKIKVAMDKKSNNKIIKPSVTG